MHITIIYATNSGGAEQAARQLSEYFRRQGHAVTLKRASEAQANDLQRGDLVILGSCTWMGQVGERVEEGQLQEHMQALLDQATKKRYPGQRFAVFGLGDSSYTNFCAAADHLERFVQASGGRQVGSTLRFDGFFFDLDRSRERVNGWARELQDAIENNG